MLPIAREAVARRLRLDNPWWEGPFKDASTQWPRRAYYDALSKLLRQGVQRAVILMGARRVGKTTLLRQLIAEANEKQDLGPAMYVSVDAPPYSGMSLEKLLLLFEEVYSHEPKAPRLAIFDEIQYLPDWERELKDLVDRFPNTRFLASGSAGAALKRKSTESGAGRFTDFELPPLTFAEFLDFTGQREEMIDDNSAVPRARDSSRLATLFVEYVNVGGYPEVVRNPDIRADMERFVRNDIVQKVLLQDLPTLYGISNIPELNRLFTTVAYNSGQLISLEDLSRNSGIAKPTIARYLEYLEAAFLIVRVRRVDDNARRLQRERNFKVFLTNPSMRAALFGPTSEDDKAMGALAETALVTQYLHAPIFSDLCFARWPQGEVDLVRIDPGTQKPLWSLEVKWSDTTFKSPQSWAALVEFATANDLDVVHMTARTIQKVERVGSLRTVVHALPLLCFQIGRLAATQRLLRHEAGLPSASG